MTKKSVVAVVVLVIVLAASMLALRAHASKTERATALKKNPWISSYAIQLPTDGGRLGVEVQDLSEGLREALKLGEEEGVLINKVSKESPAEKAGLKVGDVILEVDKEKIPDSRHLVMQVRTCDPGDEVEIVIWRDGKTQTFRAKLEESEEHSSLARGLALSDVTGIPNLEILEHLNGAFLGVSTMELDENLAEYFQTKAQGGALVIGVEGESAAEEAGIKTGDVITKLGEKEVKGPATLVKAVSKHEPGDKVDVTVLRKGKELILKAELGKRRSPVMMSVPDVDEKSFRILDKLQEEDLPDEELELKMQEMEKKLQELQRSLEGLEEKLDRASKK